MPNGFGPLDFFSGLGRVFRSVVNAIVAAIAVIINVLIAVVNFILFVLQAVIFFLGKAFGVVIRALKHVISDIVHGRFAHLLADLMRLRELLRRWFAPVLKILRKLREFWDLWFKRTIKPILDLIQQVRGVLVVFRVLGFEWAKALDRKLLQLEGKIIRNSLVFREAINRIATWVNLILEPELLIRGEVFLRTVLRNIKAAVSLVTKLRHGDIFGIGAAPLGPAGGPLLSPAVASESLLRLVRGEGDEGEYARAERARWREMFEDVMGFKLSVP